MSKFKPGDRVVCVDAGGWSGAAANLVVGKQYIIAWVSDDDDDDYITVETTECTTRVFQNRFKLVEPSPEPQPKLNTPITDAVTRVYEAVIVVPEEHRSSVLRAVLELL